MSAFGGRIWWARVMRTAGVFGFLETIGYLAIHSPGLARGSAATSVGLLLVALWLASGS